MPLKHKLLVEISLVRVIVIALQIVFLKLYTKNTSTFELGIYYFLITISYSINAFILVPLDYFQQSRLYMLKSKLLSIRSFKSINIRVAYLAIALLFIGVCLTALIKPALCGYVFVTIALAFSTYFGNLCRGFINNLEKRRQAIYCLFLENITKIGVYLLLIKLYNASSLLILLSLLLASLTSLSMLFFFLRRMDEYKLKEKMDFELKSVLSFSYPLSIGALINWVQLQGYTLILVPLGLVEMVGIYGTVSSVGSSGMNAYSTIFSQIFIPNLYKSHGKYIKTYLRNAFLSVLFVLAFSFCFKDLIVGLLTKHEFIGYSVLILFGILTEAGNFLIGALTIYITIHNLTRKTTLLGVVGLIFFIVSFGVIFLLKSVNVYTIGLPIVLTQIVITLILLKLVFSHKPATSEFLQQ